MPCNEVFWGTMVINTIVVTVPKTLAHYVLMFKTWLYHNVKGGTRVLVHNFYFGYGTITLPSLWVDHGGSLARQYYITSIHIGGLNTPKSSKIYFLVLRGQEVFLIWHSDINIGVYFILVGWETTFKYVYILGSFPQRHVQRHVQCRHGWMQTCPYTTRKWHFTLTQKCCILKYLI